MGHGFSSFRRNYVGRGFLHFKMNGFLIQFLHTLRIEKPWIEEIELRRTTCSVHSSTNYQTLTRHTFKRLKFDYVWLSSFLSDIDLFALINLKEFMVMEYEWFDRYNKVLMTKFVNLEMFYFERVKFDQILLFMCHLLKLNGD